MFPLHWILNEENRQLQEIEDVRIPRVFARDPLQALTEEEFVQRYRLSKDAVSDLLDELHPVAPRIVNGRGM